MKRCGKNFINVHHVDYKILAFELREFIFLALQKTKDLHFTRLHSYEKISKMVVTLSIHSLKQVDYMLGKNFKSFGVVQHIRKK